MNPETSMKSFWGKNYKQISILGQVDTMPMELQVGNEGPQNIPTEATEA